VVIKNVYGVNEVNNPCKFVGHAKEVKPVHKYEIL